MIALADVAVVVADAKASAAWWKTHLGFAVHTLEGSGHGVMVAPPGERFVLHLCQGLAPLEPGNTGIAFMTDELEALVGRLEKAGVVFPEPLRKEAWGAYAKFADPDGNVFWLMGAPAPFLKRMARLRAPAAKKPAKAPRKARAKPKPKAPKRPVRKAARRRAR